MFGHSLSKKLATLDPHGNMLVSPFSVATAMSMALVGAKGATKQEMLSAMGLQGFNDESIKRSFLSMLSRKHENTTKPTDPYPSEFAVFSESNIKRLLNWKTLRHYGILIVRENSNEYRRGKFTE